LDELVAWLLAAEMGRDKLALLVLCTLSTSVLVAHLRWRLRNSALLDRLWARGLWSGRWLVEFWRLFFYVGIPLAVMSRGALQSEMGLPITLVGPSDAPRGESVFAWHWIARGLAWMQVTDVEGLVRLGAGLAAGLGALAAQIVIWTWYVRKALPSARLRLDPLPLAAWSGALRHALLAQFMWAFYRGFAMLLAPQRAQAALLALALISVPWALDPRHWHDLLSTRGCQVVMEWMLALSTVLVSLVTRQLWFLVGMHALWVWVGTRLLAHLSERVLESSVPGISPPAP
jgi:hypothetical protein